MADSLRLFIAIDLPPHLRQALGREIDRLALLAPEKVVRWVRPDAIHLTLKFLGDCPAGRVDEIAAAMAQSARGVEPFSIVAGGLGLFPNPREPRVIWAGLQEATGRLAVLQKRVEEGIARLGFVPERRSYNPHLTLGRTGRDAGLAEKRRLGEILAAQIVPILAEAPVSEITLFRSELKPGGAIYTRLSVAPFQV